MTAKKPFNYRRLCIFLTVLLFLCLFFIFQLLGGFGRISSYLDRKRLEAEDKQLTTEEVIITVPGLETDYRFLFISDTHVVTSADTDSADVNSYAASRLPMFVNDSGMTSARQFSGWISMANEQKVDALLLGGDIIDCPSDSNLDFLRTQLAGLKVPYLYTLGNHDWTLPWAYLNDHAVNYYLPLFAPFMGQHTAFHVLRLEGLTIAAIDNSSDQINPAVIEPLKALLSEGTPVILLLHVPLYTEDLAQKANESWGRPIVLGEGGITPNEASAQFFDLIYGEHSPVAAVLGGHLHLRADTLLPGNIPQYVTDGGYKGRGLMIHVVGSPN